ncbi:NYN domain-containing protein [Sphingomonas sp. KR1UV-12]|uniref:NYN domain-containing protein n=1 Tax=Sphingomonas aurea TaxID=3063994 RepID=A0ABT9ELQ9_9SPHN|nr:NYN domain-containing protein [Sphingomonas sp. KR1UV-12]MDP1027757.1 NYN domain-containing protein [Sphingomonas sp. KR1UV-12]
MTRADPLPRLAVLIDAENISPRIAQRLFEEIATFGEASVRRIYGDFSEERLKGWAQILADHAIIPQQNFALTVGKNGSDIALVIDAMDLLHSGRFAGFCLVSSDSDFTRLAARLREQGLDVFGFGEAKTPKSFRQACKRFVLTENLLPRSEPIAPAPSQKTTVGAAAAPHPASLTPADATAMVLRAIAQLEDEEGWVHLGGLGSRLLAMDPEFDPRTYGCAKLTTLIEKAGGFEVRRGGGMSVQVRQKSGPH